MATLDTTPRLLCGRPVDQVWADLDHPPTSHELGCLYCQAARRSLDNLTAATHALLEADETNPDLQLSESTIANITTIARAEVRRSRRVPLDHHTSAEQAGNTDLSISEQAIATVIRRLADNGSHDAEVRHCRIDLDLNPALPTRSNLTTVVDDPSKTGDLEHATRLAVKLTVSLPLQRPVQLTVEALRSELISGVYDQLGLLTSRIDIHVEDLHDLT